MATGSTGNTGSPGGEGGSAVLMSGFDLRLVELPLEATVLRGAPTMPALPDFAAAARAAFDKPVSGPPLGERVTASTRVTVVIDDFSFPVPQAQRDCRRELLEATLGALDGLGVRGARVTVLVANGLSRQWRQAELVELLGPTGAQVVCHDAEAVGSIVRIGELPDGPVEFNKAVIEADLVVHLNVVSMPIHAGLFNVVNGTTGYRTARYLQDPRRFETDAPPFLPLSPYHAIHERVAQVLRRRTRIAQLSVVLDNALVGSRLAGLDVPNAMLSRPLQMWNAIPAAVRQRAARLLKASYRPIQVLFGDVDEVAQAQLEAFRAQHEVALPDGAGGAGGAGAADVVMFGVPDVGPGSVGTLQDPVVSSTLALGYIAGLYSSKPLLREGGVILFSNPLTPQFDRAHAAHQEFYEKVLRLERDAKAIHERFEPYFAGRPEFVSSYERRFCYHGTHPLYSWYLTAPARRRASKIVVAHGDPRSCARLGFTPANDFEDGFKKARETLGIAKPRILVLQQPPPFWVRA